MTTTTATAPGQALATLGPSEVALRTALERRFLAWAEDCSADPMLFPPLMAVEDLNRLDYFQNFPHLAILGTSLTPDAIAELGAGGVNPGAALEVSQLNPVAYALPSAACYNVWLHLRDTTLEVPARRITTVATCFRREDRFEGLRRLLGFSMREIVIAGEREQVLEHLQLFRGRVHGFLQALGLDVKLEAASDPFFDPSAGRALMAQLFPVKEEFVVDGSLAVGSVNFHRNFFGERLGIRTTDGEAAFTGCVAFGIERWIAVLTARYPGEDGAALAARVDAA